MVFPDQVLVQVDSQAAIPFLVFFLMESFITRFAIHIGIVKDDLIMISFEVYDLCN